MWGDYKSHFIHHNCELTHYSVLIHTSQLMHYSVVCSYITISGWQSLHSTFLIVIRLECRTKHTSPCITWPGIWGARPRARRTLSARSTHTVRALHSPNELPCHSPTARALDTHCLRAAALSAGGCTLQANCSATPPPTHRHPHTPTLRSRCPRPREPLLGAPAGTWEPGERSLTRDGLTRDGLTPAVHGRPRHGGGHRAHAPPPCRSRSGW